jgi:hypothetical protein
MSSEDTAAIEAQGSPAEPRESPIGEKAMPKRKHVLQRQILMAFLFLLVGSARASAQTTSFTYQGELTEGGNPADGTYDFQFSLFDSVSDGTQIGAMVARNATSVSGGVFTVQLDFGTTAFPGANRFLEIAVRPNGGGSFTTLSPRQQISSAPYAIRTLSAATADGLSSACVGCVQSAQINSVAGSKVTGTIPAASVPSGSGNYVQNTTTQQAGANFNIAGNGVVGGNLTVAGTLNANVSGNFIQNRSTPQANANFNVSGNGTVGGTFAAGKLEVAAQEGLVITGFQPFLTLRDTNAGGARGIVSSASGDLGLYTESSIGGSPTVLIKNTSGNVGIGVSNPTSKVEIAAQDGLAITGFQPYLTLRDTNAGGARSLVSTGNGDLGFYTNSSIGVSPTVVIKNTSGNVGIGVSNPTSKVEIAAQDGLAITGFQPYLTLRDTNAGGARGIISTGNGDLGFYTNSSIGGAPTMLLKSGSGNLSIDGNATQARGSGGWAKAMVYVNGDGTILRCYNGQTGSSSGNCGFSVVIGGSQFPGFYKIDFNFRVDDRFLAVTVQNQNVVGNFDGASVSFAHDSENNEGIYVSTYQLEAGPSDRPFMIIVY